MSAAPEISVQGICKQFGAVVALDGVDFRLEPGRVHALLGENGAGKSTLMGVLFGLVRPDRGTVAVNGRAADIRSPRDAIRAGIGMVQQHFSHVPALTVAENVALGGSGRFDPRSAARTVASVAADARLALDPAVRVSELTVEAQQRLEIIRALAHGARTLILDEPTAVLAPHEANQLLAWLRRFADGGGAVAFVTHKVREALAVADDVSVLRAGRRVAAGAASAFTPESLAAAMFPDVPPTEPPQAVSNLPRAAVVTARSIQVAGSSGERGIEGATFEIHAGEIVGVAGVEGAGHGALLRALAGLLPAVSGELHLPRDISFVPGDRHRDALVLDFPLYQNLALRHCATMRGVVPWRAVRERTRRLIVEFQVRADSEQSSARTLSGGNQQRFVLARELESLPPLLVVENPTRGLDLMATAAVHARLAAAAAAGSAVVVYSSDLDEVFALASRVLVVHNGTAREVPLDRQLVARAMVGSA